MGTLPLARPQMIAVEKNKCGSDLGGDIGVQTKQSSGFSMDFPSCIPKNLAAWET